MAVIAASTAPNFAFGEYFRILRSELLCTPEDPIPREIVYLGFYANAYARDTRPDMPLYTYSLVFPIMDMKTAGMPDPRDRLYAMVLANPLFAGTNAAADTQSSE